MSEDLTRKLDADVPIRAWLTDPLAPDVRSAITRLSRAPDVRRIAVMPDVHLGEGSCIGVVLATETLVYPQAVGSDIGCGVTALALDADASFFADSRTRERALAAMGAAVPILRHRTASAAPDALRVRSEDLSDPRLAAAARREGHIELGTLGRGNHFLEIQVDCGSCLWLTVHSGSRVMGQMITRSHLSRAQRANGGLMFLNTSTQTGQAYMNDLDWATRYAQANREAILSAAAQSLHKEFGIPADDAPPWGTDHNHARFEIHDNLRLLVHRKGASPAVADTYVIIPGSMATPTYHAIGRGVDAALRSSSHGAGRAVPRGLAHRTISAQALLAATEGVTFNRRAVAQLVDEAPGAYRDVRRVMRAQRDLVRIERTLMPLVCLKGV
jgi:tRNA-splicing ligase RtcB